ncbi:uncharacterized protein [Typha angustifolia]|uniref:uncharacterized protein n=1 Tax=Typha angustifolia TaxID=59011 RepID=UPI003C3046B7
MEASASSRSRSKRDFEDSVDLRSSRMEDDDDWDDADKRKSRSSKSRKHSNSDEVEELDEGRKKVSADRSDFRKKLGSSSQAGSDDEDDYSTRRESRSSKVPRKNTEERGEKRSTDGYKDRDGDSGRKRRDEENELDSSRRMSLKASGYESSQSRTRSKVESPYDGERERLQEKDMRYSERKDSSREKSQGHREQEKNPPRRRWDDADVGKKAEESSIFDKADRRTVRSSDHSKDGSVRDRGLDYGNESSDNLSRVNDSGGEKGGCSGDKEGAHEDGDRSKSHGRMENHEEDSRVVNTSHEDRSDIARDDKHRRFQERSASFIDDVEQSKKRYDTKQSEGKGEKHIREWESASHDEIENRQRSANLDEDGRSSMRDRSSRDGRHSKRSRSPERSGRYRREFDEHDQGFSDSDNERNVSIKVKEREEVHGDDRFSKGKGNNWNDKNRDREGSKDQWRRSQTRQDSKDGDEFDPVKEWDLQRDDQERVELGNFNSRSGYRKDSRIRSEGAKSSSAFGNRNESSDSIEIRPNKSLDFGREGSVSGYAGRRGEVGLQQEFASGASDDEWAYPSEDRGKATYAYGDDSQERFHDDDSPRDQNSARNTLDYQSGRGRMPKGPMTSNRTGGGQSGSSSLISPLGNGQGSASFSRSQQQGSKGGRPARGGRGRLNARDAQRIGVPMPMMGPPFGHLGLPPGPMQPLGPNMSHSPGPPIGPGVFIPPFPGPLVWPGARGIDMNMLAVPPNLPPIPPPGPAGPRFAPNMGAGPNHPMYLNQPGAGRGTPPNISGPVFNPMGTPSREMQHEKGPTGWAPSRNSGPSGKAPSRGEQNDYSQNFVDTGMRPQNFIRELELTSVVEDYPKLRELIQRKDEIVAKSASPPMYYNCDLREHVLSPESFGTKFDVILVDPPWEEYVHRAPGITDHIEYWTFEEIMNLKIEAIADTPSFIFLWVGDGMGLEQGRQCLKKWGFRRCEDICWVKTNKRNATPGLRHDSHTLLQHSKEHCLMGIKGTVRRSTDGHIIHANIDTDIVIAEEPSDGSTKKPEDMYRIIEHFALGRRRLELFGEDHNIRSGWLTVGKGLSSSNFNKEAYIRNFADKDGKVWQGGGGRNPPPDAPHLVMTTPEIESLRPKSPPQKNQQQQSLPMSTPGNSGNRRNSGNSPQNSLATISSDPSTPAPWNSSPMMGFRVPEAGHGGFDERFLDSYGFNASGMQANGDHADFDSQRMPKFL